MSNIVKENIRVIAFDADDTLWDNQSLYDEAEKNYGQLLAPYTFGQDISSTLFKVESSNMPLMGYGTKAFVISLMQNALEMSRDTIPAAVLHKILNIGTSLLNNPATPFSGVRETLTTLYDSGRYKLACFTKGELLDQENKCRRSGLYHLFHHIEITSDKSEQDYINLCTKLGINPSELLMVGNSFKSDIHPIVTLGGYGIYIPYKRMWQYEHLEEYEHDHVIQVQQFSDILQYL